MADMLLRTIQDLDEARGLLRSVGIALGLCYCHECAATAPAAMLTRIEALKRAEVERDGTRRLVAGHSTLTVRVPTEVEVEVANGRVVRVHAARHPSLAEIAAMLRGEDGETEARCVRCLRGLGRPDGGVCAECDGAEEVACG